MTIAILIFAALAVFYAGKRYGARVEETAVDVALAVFTRAKNELVKVSQAALADIKAKEARITASVSKYL